MAEKQQTRKEDMPKKEPVQPKSISNQGSKSISFLSVLALIIAIAAIATAAYTIKLNRELHNSYSQQKNILNNRILELQQQQISLQSTIDSTAKTLENTEKEIQDRMASLQQQVKTTLQQRLYEKKDWMLLKARYYLELAQINTHWSDNLATTVALLQQADTLLADINEQKIFAIRQAINKEITTIRTSSKVDIVGLLSQLDAALNNVSKLAFPLPLEDASTAKETVTEKNTNSKAWRERLQNSVTMLEKLVVIQRHDEDIKPLLSSQYLAVIKEVIRLNLQEAQWAVLKGNNSIFQRALNQAKENIERNFDSKDPATAALLDQINHLKTKDLSITKPEINLSLPLLTDLINDISDSTAQQAPKGDPS